MTSEDRPTRGSGAGTGDSDASDQVTDVTSGKGRRDEVGHTGIYPGSATSDVPGDAEVVTPGQFGSSRERTARESDGQLTPADTGRDPASDSAESHLEWTPSPNIVPEGERSDR